MSNNNSFSLDYIICPNCGVATQRDEWVIMGDVISGIIFGYIVICKKCNSQNYINILGRPLLFDLRKNNYGQLS